MYQRKHVIGWQIMGMFLIGITSTLTLFFLSYDVTYGARPLKRVIQKAILNPLATKMIEGTIGDADRVTIVVKGEALDFEVEKGVAKQFLEEVEEESKEKENSA
jgi:hypothetical protein